MDPLSVQRKILEIPVKETTMCIRTSILSMLSELTKWE